jgi:hypothetical protein
MVRMKKKVPINSTMYFFMMQPSSESRPEGADEPKSGEKGGEHTTVVSLGRLSHEGKKFPLEA